MPNQDYAEHYDLMQLLSQQPRIIEAPDLANNDEGQIYAAAMDRAAQPLPDGSPSPLSSRSVGSAHARLIEILVHLLNLHGHELNLVPYYDWVQLYRMMGVEIAPAEYPIINLVFVRSRDSITSTIPATIPFGTEIRSAIDPSLIAITTQTVEISGIQTQANVPARLNRLGKIPELTPGEFSTLPRSLAFVESVYNDGTIYNSGRDKETLGEAMLRARELFRTGDRCVTLSDYEAFAIYQGTATKAKSFRGTDVTVLGMFNDLVTVAVYPPEVVTYVESILLPLTPADSRLDVKAAVIIPIIGNITIRVIPHLSDDEARLLARDAINTKINPPAGVWGDTNLPGNLATVLELIVGIYAVPIINLIDANTGLDLAKTVIEPWYLFEIQRSLVINIVRS